MDNPLAKLIATLSENRRRAAWPEASREDCELLLQRAEGGDGTASFWLGWVYANSGREAAGWPHIRRAAEMRVPAAVAESATSRFWRSAIDDPVPDHAPADVISDWRFAAEAGDYVAQYMLGVHTDHGPYALSSEQCLEYLHQSAAAGYADGCWSLGQSYYLGRELPQDMKRAAGLFRAALEQSGSRLGADELAALHAEGHGVERDAAKCVEYLKLGLDLSKPEDRLNLGEACCGMAVMYLDGWIAGQTSSQRMAKALFWFSQAVRAGHWQSALSLVACCRRCLHDTAESNRLRKVGDLLDALLAESVPRTPECARPSGDEWYETLREEDLWIARFIRDALD